MHYISENIVRVYEHVILPWNTIKVLLFQIKETGNFTESFGRVFHVSGKVRVYVVMSESIH